MDFSGRLLMKNNGQINIFLALQQNDKLCHLIGLDNELAMVLKSGTVGNSLRVVGGGFGRKNAEVGGQTPRLRPIPGPYPAKTPIQEGG
jgi:hypothetical protein